MKNFVISLESAIDRREHIHNEFGRHNVSFEFFDALTPNKAKSHAQSLALDLSTASLTLGELACMMSHVSIWKNMIDENISYATIFEDDVYLGEDAESLLNSSEWINADWHIIKIEAFAKKAMVSATKYDVLSSKRQIRQLKGKNLGAAGYILSIKGAKLFLDYILTCRLQPIDEIIFDIFINQKIEPVYQMIPALCVQEMIIKVCQNKLMLPSSLEQERKCRRKLEKKKGFSKVTRETKRLMLQTKETFFSKEIAFK
jgi:glycosyl transferase family 25